MTCPRCYAEFDPDPASCPECGLRLVRNVSGVMKVSAVMISEGEERGFYHSVQDVPEPLRSRLKEVTTSANSGTIVIADRAGKEQITQVIARRETARGRAVTGVAAGVAAGMAAKEDTAATSRKPLDFSFLGVTGIVWAGVALVLAASGVITAVFVTHW